MVVEKIDETLFPFLLLRVNPSLFIYISIKSILVLFSFIKFFFLVFSFLKSSAGEIVRDQLKADKLTTHVQ